MIVVARIKWIFGADTVSTFLNAQNKSFQLAWNGDIRYTRYNYGPLSSLLYFNLKIT